MSDTLRSSTDVFDSLYAGSLMLLQKHYRQEQKPNTTKQDRSNYVSWREPLPSELRVPE